MVVSCAPARGRVEHVARDDLVEDDSRRDQEEGGDDLAQRVDGTTEAAGHGGRLRHLALRERLPVRLGVLGGRVQLGLIHSFTHSEPGGRTMILPGITARICDAAVTRR